MTTVAELIAGVKAAEQQRAAKVEQFDRYRRFYRSRAWRAARYKFLKTQVRPLRCRCCGATAADARLVVDHVVSLKRDWSCGLDESNFQVLCNDCNLAKASHDETDWRAGEVMIDKVPAMETGATHGVDG